MKKAILGKKLGMTQVFAANGLSIPVTVIEAGPCVVVQKKTVATDGYSAIQVGYEDRPDRKLNKPQRGHFAAHGVSPKRYLREFRLDDAADMEVGQEIRCDLFSEGDLVDVTATSKGRGYAGGVKRWNFTRGRMTHGSKFHRAPGSLAARGPAHVFKNRKMPGHLGAVRKTIQNLSVVRVDTERNLLLIRGSVPGIVGALVTVKNAVKK
ncbi:MAG: 50S ribosomal protein L3 [Symbiobacteriaceae bacterium]|nr:50S ribosomal protein L3 [Symbiobacteriaceae bacterium]